MRLAIRQYHKRSNDTLYQLQQQKIRLIEKQLSMKDDEIQQLRGNKNNNYDTIDQETQYLLQDIDNKFAISSDANENQINFMAEDVSIVQVPKKTFPLFQNADQVSKRVVVKGNMIEDPIESQGCNISCLQQRLQELNQLIEENNNNVNNNDNNFKEENQIIMSKLEEKIKEFENDMNFFLSCNSQKKNHNQNEDKNSHQGLAASYLNSNEEDKKMNEIKEKFEDVKIRITKSLGKNNHNDYLSHEQAQLLSDPFQNQHAFHAKRATNLVNANKNNNIEGSKNGNDNYSEDSEMVHEKLRYSNDDEDNEDIIAAKPAEQDYHYVVQQIRKLMQNNPRYNPNESLDKQIEQVIGDSNELKDKYDELKSYIVKLRDAKKKLENELKESRQLLNKSKFNNNNEGIDNKETQNANLEQKDILDQIKNNLQGLYNDIELNHQDTPHQLAIQSHQRLEDIREPLKDLCADEELECYELDEGFGILGKTIDKIDNNDNNGKKIMIKKKS